ncbi:hypothetical protein Pth03_27600 [Planotetraspora thailandica]|uniref:HTH luxR-type domain-containing protein n=1 Tax=Planotetraspora thailandica TaxID=487172 RepID=A0A8J3V0H9_9ACTN|nr:hypothetical protein Pth03_27600 [Planotetraspora thailandica]
MLYGIAAELAELARRAADQADRTDISSAAVHNLHVINGNGSSDPGNLNEEVRTELAQAEHEILMAQSDGGWSGALLEDSLDVMLEKITAGVAMHVLFQHSKRFDQVAKSCVHTITAHGGSVRTLPEIFDQLLIVDRVSAFIPANAERSTIVRITEPAAVRFMAEVFDGAWDRAEPFPFVPTCASQAASEVIPEIRESILRLLSEGRTDREIARRLGLSLRSIQAHVARLKEDFGAQNRFQLGYHVASMKTR